jgi:uncharacterized protein
MEVGVSTSGPPEAVREPPEPPRTGPDGIAPPGPRQDRNGAGPSPLANHPPTGPLAEPVSAALTPTEPVSVVPSATEPVSVVPSATEPVSVVPSATEPVSVAPPATEPEPVFAEAVSGDPASNGAGPAGTAIPEVIGPDPPPHRWGLGAYLLAEAVFLGANVLLVLPFYARDPGGRPPAAVLLLGLILPTALAACVALLAARLRGNGPRIDLGLRFERTDLVRGLAFGCGGLALTIPAAALWSQAVGAAAANSAVGELFAGQRPALPLAIAVFLVVWLIAPICEEIVYRGLLWGAVRRHGADRWWAFGLTTLSFALAHFEFSRTPLLLVISVPIGLARLYTDRLGASIVAHQVNNLLPAVSLFFLLTGVLGP